MISRMVISPVRLKMAWDSPFLPFFSRERLRRSSVDSSWSICFSFLTIHYNI